MYQNFNCCSSDWMERTKYIQGRSGTKSKDCLPFVQYYKCLENKIENKNIQRLHLCPDCPSSHPIRKFLPISQIPSSLPPKIPDSFSLREASSKSLQVPCLSSCNAPTVFILSLLTGPCAITPSWGCKETFKNER